MSQYMTMIATEFGTFRYICLTMVMCTSGDIFQAKIYKLFSDIEGVTTYIYNILFLGKKIFSEHI